MRSMELCDLFDHGWLYPTEIEGIVSYSARFEQLSDAVNRHLDAFSPDGCKRIQMPPGIPQAALERGQYLQSFPELAGHVHSFAGDRAQKRAMASALRCGDDIGQFFTPTQLSLTPAACYGVYPIVARGAPIENSVFIDVSAFCFRNEEECSAHRLRMFRMREFVCVGSAVEVKRFHSDWVRKSNEAIESFGISCATEVANDPFSGLLSAVMVESQLRNEDKVEIVAIKTPAFACMSTNYHGDKFAKIYDIRLIDGELAHSACVGIGLDRIVVALLKDHGLELSSWPYDLLELLQLSPPQMASNARGAHV